MVSAFFYGSLGMAFTFLPQEALTAFGVAQNPYLVLCLQALGAFSMALALMNYTARRSVIGGIYSRPLLLGNTVNSVIMSIALVKYGLSEGTNLPLILIGVCVTYLLIALGFVKLMFGSPVKQAHV